MFPAPTCSQADYGGFGRLGTIGMAGTKPGSEARRSHLGVSRMGCRHLVVCIKRVRLGRDGRHPQDRRLARRRSPVAPRKVHLGACVPAAGPKADEEEPDAQEHFRPMHRVEPRECIKVFGAYAHLDGGHAPEIRRTLAAAWASCHSKRPHGSTACRHCICQCSHEWHGAVAPGIGRQWSFRRSAQLSCG